MMVGESIGIRRVRALIQRLGPTSLPIHIHGPTGAGKELVARALHSASARTGKLVSLNVSAIADGLFESTLFGHVRGSFTGAVTSEHGALVEAHRGSIFLDEIGGLSHGGQAKLLRAIELQEFRPVGARQDRSSQFRVISATNDDLEARAGSGDFRRDLLHRLKGAVINIPPLSDRLEDIRPLARTFASRHGVNEAVFIDESALRELEEREWPGNVRELLLVVQCAAALAGDDRISRANVLEALDLQRIRKATRRPRVKEKSARLLAALETHQGDIDAVVDELKVHRATIYRTIRRYGRRESNAE